MSNSKTLPTPSYRRSVHDTHVLVGKEGSAPSQPPAHPAGTKTWAAYTPLNPTIRPFAGKNLGHKPGAGAAGGAPKRKAQGVAEELAVLAGAGSRQIDRANANALAAEALRGEGCWRNQWARAVI